jgi:hypothetical protein
MVTVDREEATWHRALIYRDACYLWLACFVALVNWPPLHFVSGSATMSMSLSVRSYNIGWKKTHPNATMGTVHGKMVPLLLVLACELPCFKYSAFASCFYIYTERERDVSGCWSDSLTMRVLDGTKSWRRCPSAGLAPMRFSCCTGVSRPSLFLNQRDEFFYLHPCEDLTEKSSVRTLLINGNLDPGNNIKIRITTGRLHFSKQSVTTTTPIWHFPSNNAMS